MSITPVPAAKIPLPVPIAEDNWEKMLNDYYEMSAALYSKPYANHNQFFAQFRKLRELKPKDFEPFLPLFTFLLGNFDDEQFATILKEAKDCDYYLTYALILHVLHNQSTMGVHFELPETKKLAILVILHRVYPDDLLLPGIIQSLLTNKKEIVADISPIQTCLSNSLAFLISNKPTEALKELFTKTNSLAGYSLLHGFIALAWAQMGKFPNAKTSLQRSTELLDIHRSFTSDHLKELVSTCINNAFGQPISPIDKNDQPNLLAALIELLEGTPPDHESAFNFILVSLTSLKTNCSQLPFVYFGMCHLFTHFKYTSEWQPVFYPLLELSAMTANISYRKDPDPWITERFKKIVSGKEIKFQIAFSKANPKDNEPAPIPKFRFSTNLALDDASNHFIASSSTRQLYYLIIKLMDAIIEKEGIGLKIFTPPPVDPVNFRATLEKDLTKDHDVPSFYLSTNYLRTYLSLQNRPFQLDDQFLNWAKFCVFSAETPCFLQSTMDQEIMQSFYPETFTEQLFKAFQQQLNCKNPIVTDQKTPFDIRLAARDTLLACHDLSLRAEPLLFEQNDLYGLYKTSKHHFGWHPKESLSEWCERLQTTDPMETEDKRFQNILNFYLDFWREFQKQLVPDKRILLKKNLAPQKQSKITVMAGALIVNAEYPADKAFHKACMESEEEAETLCRILLEVSTDRLVRRAIAHMGPEDLKDTAVRAHLSNYLHPLLGAFKKPSYEKAPFQASVVTNDYTLSEIALFYPRNDETPPAL